MPKRAKLPAAAAGEAARPRRTGPDDLAIGRKIRALRLERGLTQEALGREIGVTFQQVQKYERGANRVSAARLQRIADVLQVAVTFFYRSDEPDAARRDASFGYLKSRKALRLTRAFAGIKAAPARNALVFVTEMILRQERKG